MEGYIASGITSGIVLLCVYLIFTVKDLQRTKENLESELKCLKNSLRAKQERVEALEKCIIGQPEYRNEAFINWQANIETIKLKFYNALDSIVSRRRK